MKRLSVLVATVRSRMDKTLPKLLDELEWQAEGLPVEILALYDNKSMSVGEKRNRLIRAASGLYLAFVDDDDWIEPNYVSAILEKTYENPDVIVFDHLVTRDGGIGKRCIYGVGLTPAETPELWQGKPAHTHAWAAWIPKKHHFPDLNVGEDRKWSALACREVKREARIPRVLYHYRFSTTGSETRNR